MLKREMQMLEKPKTIGAVDAYESKITPEMIEAAFRVACDYCHLNVELTDGEIRFCVRQILGAGLANYVAAD
jgi:phosphosulfolactate synthase (CoM biosynthesis protein A)